MNTDFTIIITRETLIPPPVLPAQAPINIRSTKIVFAVPDHLSKSAVAKPVVVIMEATWKEASVKALKAFCEVSKIFTKIIPTAPIIIKK